MGWVLHEEDTNLPKWLKPHLSSNCKCGKPNENYYNAQNKCTARRCSDPSCPYMVAEKIVSMCDILKVKGIGPETALRYARNYKLTNVFQAMPYIFKEKPYISLYDYMRCCFIKGISTRWAEVVSNYKDVDDLVKNYNGPYANVIQENIDLILSGKEYVNIIEGIQYELEPLIKGNVMITGNIKGLVNRESLVYGLNINSHGLIRLNVVGKRKTNVMCLIMESDAKPSGKSVIAQECHIPIMTSEQFIEYMTNLLKKRLEEKKFENRRVR